MQVAANALNTDMSQINAIRAFALATAQTAPCTSMTPDCAERPELIDVVQLGYN